MQPQHQWCDNKACADFGKTHAQNIKVYSYVERRFYCATCGQTFVFDKGTFFETVRTSRAVLLDVMAMLVERNSLRAISRIKHCAPNTILHWLDLAGQQAAAVSLYLIKDLHLTQAQIDELWTFVKKNKRIFNPLTPMIEVMPGSGEPSLCRRASV
jgi:transposase-like protein